ncbi:TPA: DUF2075 domain-containing protein [Staphylococcus aureus]|nr:DUF2075 domain-containing protein [Staphylococcus aureus]
MITQSLKIVINFSNENFFQDYLNKNNMSLKKTEIEDIKKFVALLNGKLEKNSNLFRGYILGYSFQDLTGEFDLLRFTETHIINIELKSRDTTEKEIEDQLKRNKFYLGSTNYTLLQYGFLSSENKLYKLNEEDLLREINVEEFISECSNLKNKLFINVEELFRPEKFIISPFNNTQEFLEGKYFLNDEQVKIKKCLTQFLNNDDSIVKLTGVPGCGKSLILYDFYKECLKIDKKVALMHCGAELNDGQLDLIKGHDWNIYPPKANEEFISLDADIYMIDEAQRKYPHQLEKIYSYIKENDKKLIISYDPEQTLVKRETKWNISKTIAEDYEGKTLNLESRIRNNKEISSFIRLLLNKNQSNYIRDFKNIEIVYANDISESKTILKFLDNTYTVIDYTAPNFNRKGYNEISNMRYGNTILNSHNVIGQEFDNVCLILGNEFFYDNDGFLRANDVNDQLDLMKLLYQNVTRTKHKLVLVVNRNKELYIDLLTILKPRIQKSIKLKEIENIGYNTIPNSKGVFYIFKHNNNILKNENTGEDINVKGNILYVESCKDLRKAIKSLITNIITKKLKKFEDIEIADLLNLKVSWIDSKNKEQIFSYIVEQHIEKYGEIPFLNIPLKLKGYSDNIIRNYSYIVEYD